MKEYKKKKYVSVDVESSGLTPGKYSCLSIGACIVGETEKQFYVELKPITQNYVYDAMKIGCLGLKCISDLKHINEYNPKSDNFDPKKVLAVLAEKGVEPRIAMTDFASWVMENTRGFRAIEIAAPIKYDGMFTAWYFDNFYDKKNPLGFSGEDMNSFLRGVVGDVDAHMDQLKIKDERIQPHNALDDAIQQAKEFEYILELVKKYKILKEN